MKKILWLTSWYPNRTDMFTGDFIQRHAKAASIYNHIIVLHITKIEKDIFGKKNHEEINHSKNLTEHIVYYQMSSFFKPVTKIISLIKYFRISRKLISQYMKEEKPQLVHVHVPLKAGLMGLWVSKKYKIPFILTDHYGIYNNMVDEPFEQRSWLFKYFTKKIIEKAEIFSPVSADMGISINKMLIEKPFSVIYNVVDTSLFNYRKNENEIFRFIHVSGLTTLKNVEGIVRCFAELFLTKTNIELVIVGKFDDKIFHSVKETGLLNTSIFLMGEISYHEVAREMQRSHSLILFSNTENMPCVVLEALCCGLPVIATNVGGIPEVISNSNGILVKSGNESELKQAITTMLEKYNSFDRENISAEAKKKFSYEVIGRQISDLYHQALSHPPH